MGNGDGVGYPLPRRLGGLWERRKLPQRGPGQSPGKKKRFLPRDLMHLRYQPWACVCPSLRLSVTSRCSIETAERIELVFGM